MKNQGLSERDLLSLRVFCAVAEAGGFSAAEASLGMSKATISRHIKDVEAHLCVKLCERGPAGFSLSEAGEMALRVAREALDALERIKPEVDGVRGVLSGPLSLGTSEHVMAHEDCHLVDAITTLHRDAPLVRPTLTVMTFGDLGHALSEKRVQIAIRGQYRPIPGLRHFPLFKETQRVFYRPDRADESARQADTRALPLVCRRHPFVTDALANHGFIPGPDVNGLEAVATMVATGRYVGLLPEQYVAKLGPRYQFEVLEDSPSYTVPFCAIIEEARGLTRSAEAFLEILLEAHR